MPKIIDKIDLTVEETLILKDVFFLQLMQEIILR